jgi:hypothetical protein
VAFVRKLQRLLPLRFSVIEPEATVDLGQYVSFPSGYRPLNPSVVRYGQDLLVCVRGIGYEVHEKVGYYRNPDGLPSLNRLFLMRDNMEFVGRPTHPDSRLDGLEDLKLFSGLGRIWAVGSVPTGDLRNPHGCVIALVEFDAGLTDCRITRLQSPLGLSYEKNWAPFIADGALYFVYSCQPLLVVRYRPENSSVTFVDSRRHGQESLKFLEGGSSGGSQMPDGMAFLTHRRVVRLPSLRRIYLSRIRRLSKDLTDFAAGPFFSIGPLGRNFRFANGMLVDDDRILITYGETDSAARLACFSAGRFKRLAFPHA